MGATGCAWFEGTAAGVVGALEAHPGTAEFVGFVAVTGVFDVGAAAVNQGDSAGAAGCDGGDTLVGAPHCVNA